MSTTRSRRRFLQGLGVGAALLPLLGPRRTHAGSNAPDGWPKRLVIVTSPNGVLADRWFPTGSETEFVLPESTAVLEPWRDQITFLSGVDYRSFLDDPLAGPLGGHQTYAAILSGTPTIDVEGLFLAAVTTLDHYIVAGIADASTLPFANLTLNGWPGGQAIQTHLSWQAPGVYTSGYGDPYALFEALFAGGALDPAEFARLRAARGSVLDRVHHDLDGFSARVGATDRVKIEAHLQAIRELEQQVSAVPSDCAPSELSAGLDPNDWAKAPALFRMQMDLLVTALACDQTRVATLQLDTDGDGGPLSWLGAEFDGAGDEFPQRNHHDMTHRAHDSAAHESRKARAEGWYMEQLAYLIGRLAETPEGGASLLDHTAVVYMNQMGEGGGHTATNIPMFIAGSCGGEFPGGRFRSYGSVPHNGVLVALANAMGVETETFGGAQYGGELPGLRVT